MCWGAFEQAVLLAVVRLRDEAYGRAILKDVQARLERDVAAGAVHATLERLEEQGAVVVASRKRHTDPRRTRAPLLPSAAGRRHGAQQRTRCRQHHLAWSEVAAGQGQEHRMTMDRPAAQPPRWAEATLRLLLKPEDRDSVSGDLLEEYRDHHRAGARARRRSLVRPPGLLVSLARELDPGRRRRPQRSSCGICSTRSCP